MKAFATKKEENLIMEEYRKIMSNIEFMQPFMQDSEIFNQNSIKCNSFLIQSFANLHPDFHYLSFLNKDEVDQEIVKVAGILQILPNFNKKTTKLFDNMSESEIHKFWLRFFGLFKTKKVDEFSLDSLIKDSLKNKTEFLKDINSTLNYLNYDFPRDNLKNFTSDNVNQEIEKWDQKSLECDLALDYSTCHDYCPEPVNNLNVEKLMIDLKHIVTTYNNKDSVSNENKSDYWDFFHNFVNLTKIFLKYKSDLNIIDSSLLDELYSKMVSKTENDLSENLYFIKRCNNLIKTLKCKIRTIE